MAFDNAPKLQVSLQRFSKILSEEALNAIRSLQDQPLPIGIRMNALKCDPQTQVRNLASKYGWDIKPIPFINHGWTIQKAAESPGITIEHRMGQYYLQDAASMVPASLFALKKSNPLILDMAASPGGKTTHLIDRTLDQGFILANDASKSRVPALRAVLTTWGGINQAITQYPGEAFGDWYPEIFDMVLLDAPCSMENLRPTLSHPIRETTRDERLRLQERQVQLLRSALSTLKVGGQLVYATCSLAPEEDEAVINQLIKAFPTAFVVEDVSDRFPYDTKGLTNFGKDSYHPILNRTVRLWPHLTGMSGFFCALITKTNPIPHNRQSLPSRDFSKTNLEWADPKLRQAISDQIADQYGLRVEEILEKFQLDLFKRHQQLFFIPQSYLTLFRNLPYEYIGMRLGQYTGDQLEPSHEFISRFGHHFTRGKIVIDDDNVDQWVAGRDIRHPQTNLPASGQFLHVTDNKERNLGMGKLLPKRLRNMLPRQSI